MHVTVRSIGMICLLSYLGGCGDYLGGSAGPGQVVTHILSDPVYDGDIEQTSPTSFIVTQGMSATVQTVLAGFDPNAGTEFRAFLDFPLTGRGGVPGDAIIDFAYLEVLVDDLTPVNGRLPVRVELVSFEPPTLIPAQFDRSAQPPLGAVRVSGNVTGADIGRYVSVDVTPLMIQAQQLRLADFQLRIMQDLGPAVGVLMEIDDTTRQDRPQRAPVLTVTYH